MRWLGKERFRFLRGQRGISLIETVVAVGILGFIGVVFLSGLATTSKSTDIYQEHVTAASLAQSQIEEIKAMDYDASDNYSVVVTLPPGYTMSIAVSTVPEEEGKQEVTVKVSRDGHHLFELTTIKADW